MTIRKGKGINRDLWSTPFYVEQHERKWTGRKEVHVGVRSPVSNILEIARRPISIAILGSIKDDF